MREHLIAIVGPTGAGKSKVALCLAQQLGGEIVSADSRQIYRRMDIGTAKPSPGEQAQVRHHLIDIVEPDGDFSLAQYQQFAYQSVTDIGQREKVPLLVGGTGLYVWAVVEGWEIPRIAPDQGLRRLLEARAASGEANALFQELTRLDPESAQRIDPRNVRRVIRALEVTRTSAVPFSKLQNKSPPPFATMMIGLNLDRTELYRRIDARVDGMVKAGLVEEVRTLASVGFGPDLPAMSGIGYRQVADYLAGKTTLELAIQQIKHETRRLVRRQYNWFRLADERIAWFDMAEGGAAEGILEKVKAFTSMQ
jgi:tRNA dimethylallyltransferase